MMTRSDVPGSQQQTAAICPVCGVPNHAEFIAEVNVHLRLDIHKNLGQPGVLLFPTLLVCLHCGFSRFSMSDTELKRLEIDCPNGGPSNDRRSGDDPRAARSIAP